MNELRRIGKYDVTGTLGEGSFGVVYRGFDPFIKRDLAIKLCTSPDKELRRRFHREAEIAGRLQHKNIVTVFAFGTEDERPYLVQELLDGEDLDQVIRRREPLPHAERLDILLQIAHALDYAHRQGVVHRDVKPGNIRRLDNGRVKLMDFGIAKLAGAQTQLTREGVTLGTASYLPPEQVRAEPLDHRADIFSFGVLAYELMSYERPFRGNTLSALVYQILYKVAVPLATVWQDCPPALSELVARCLAKKPDDRWASFGEIAPLLAQVRAGLADPPASTPAATGGKLDDTRPVAMVSDQAATDEVAIPEEGGAERAAPAPAAALSNDLDGARTVRLDEGSGEGHLVQRAAEIGTLIAKGELDSAMRQLEDTVQRHHDATQEAVLPAVPPPPEEKDAHSPAAQPPDARERSVPKVRQAAEKPEAKPPAEPAGRGSRWPWLAAAAAVALVVLVVLGLLALRGRTSDRPAPPPPAVSQPVHPPSPLDGEGAGAVVLTGVIRVVATPWAELLEMVDAEGFLAPLPDDPFTPLVLDVAGGRYRLTLAHPDNDEPAVCEVEVRVGEVVDCDPVLLSADAVAYFKSVGWWP